MFFEVSAFDSQRLPFCGVGLVEMTFHLHRDVRCCEGGKQSKRAGFGSLGKATLKAASRRRDGCTFLLCQTVKTTFGRLQSKTK